MLVHVAKDYLAKALQLALKAVSANSPHPILTGIHIQASLDELVFTGSSSSMSIQYRIPQKNGVVTIHRSGAIVVPARYLYDIVRKCRDEQIRLEMGEGLILTISSGNSQIRLCGMEASEFPSIRSAEDSSFLSLSMPNRLWSASIRGVAASVSISESRPVLTGIHFEYRDKGLHLMATDGIRLASRRIQLEGKASGNANVIVPGKHLAEASKLLEDDEDSTTEIRISNREIRFASKSMLIQLALIEGVYPMIQNVIPKGYISEVIVNASSLLNAVERAAVLAGEGIVQLSLVANELILLSKIVEIGDVRDEVGLKERSGDDFVIALNGRFLLDILRSLKTSLVTLRFTGNRSPMVIQPSDDLASALYLLSPIRTAN